MDPLWRSTVLELAIPLLVVTIALVASYLRGVDLHSDLRLVWPAGRVVALWLAVWVLWLGFGALSVNAIGIEWPRPWPSYPIAITVAQIVAIGIFGPLAEETVFRGVLYFRLSPRLGPGLTIGLLALAWALLHLRSGWGAIALIAAEGVVLGLARYRSQSLFVPITLHVVGNLVRVTQSLLA